MHSIISPIISLLYYCIREREREIHSLDTARFAIINDQISANTRRTNINESNLMCIHLTVSFEDLEEVLGDEDVSSAGLEQDDLAFIPPPEWPDSSEEENTTPLAG